MNAERRPDLYRAYEHAAATDQADRLDSSMARAALAAARSMMKPEYRNAMGLGNPFGPEIEPPVDADEWEQLAAFMGRQPR